MMEACCDDIVAVKTQVTQLRSDGDAHHANSLEWRDRHEREQRETTQRIFDKLDEIVKQLSNRLPLWATLMLSSLFTVIGFLLGVIYYLGR
jgi:hypothetical protein